MAAISTAHGLSGMMALNSDEADGASFHADDSVPRTNLSDINTQSRSVPNRPTPLPSFVFPAKAPPSSPSPRSAPSSFSRATGRRPQSISELAGRPTEKTAEADGDVAPRNKLPEFSFGSQLQSPPLSPNSVPSKSGFHKRGTSEFIGGIGKAGSGADLVSTSPTKSDSSLPTPNPPTQGPSGGRRGHAHRRSAAISCHDLSMVLKPDPSVSRVGSSAPTSPAGNLEHQLSPLPGSSFTQSVRISQEPVNRVDDSPPLKAFNRNRVGFSDTVDIIPRPLSLVSSDSSSTARQGHSVTGSMSSIISAGTSSPQSKEKYAVSTSAFHKMGEVRPKSAEPAHVCEAVQPPGSPRRRNSIPLLMENTESAPSTPRSAKKWSFFGHESISGDSSPKSRPTSAGSSDKALGLGSIPADIPPSLPDVPTADFTIQTTEPSNSRRSSVSRTASKKQKRVKSFAGSIFSRKSRQRSQKQKLHRRSPTPPLRTNSMTHNTTFDDEQQRHIQPKLQTNIASWKPRQLSPQEESMSPIIDLDAALGPFNTPTSFGDDWDTSQRGIIRKKAMHSAAGLGGFSGPGMHYHRRAESAPEFDNPSPRFGLNRLASSSTMADVFEEDEEDAEWEDAKASDKASSNKAPDDDDDTGLGIDIKIVDSDGMHADSPMDFEGDTFERTVRHKTSGLSDGERRYVSSARSEHSGASLLDEPILEEEPTAGDINDDFIPPRPESEATSSVSTATPPLRAAAKGLTPVNIQPLKLQPAYITPTSPPSTTQSSFPSPRSPFSYDAQRISTAPSSVTDEQGFQSLLMGEPGPEVRMSVDDVPSLTSSNSTMTRDSGLPVGGQNSQYRDGQRSASVSSAAVYRKRSSMASLSRLISSSHGERSKLSIESRPSTSDGESKTKTSKGKRISRMMQFWKPKEQS